MRQLLILYIFLVASCSDSTADETAVGAMFSEYQDALLQGDGEQAVELLSIRTVDYYSNLLTYARSMSEDELRRKALLDRFTVLRLRSSFSPTELSSLTGIKLLEYAIDQSWIDKEGTALFNVQSVAVNGDHAVIRMTRDGVEIPFPFDAYRETGSWKLDLTSVFKPAGMAFAKQVADSGMSEDEFIHQALKALGHPEGLSEDLWRVEYYRSSEN